MEGNAILGCNTLRLRICKYRTRHLFYIALKPETCKNIKITSESSYICKEWFVDLLIQTHHRYMHSMLLHVFKVVFHVVSCFQGRITCCYMFSRSYSMLLQVFKVVFHAAACIQGRTQCCWVLSIAIKYKDCVDLFDLLLIGCNVKAFIVGHVGLGN